MSRQQTVEEEHFLKPGEMYFAERPTIVTTVLGSCVSVTMFHQRLRVGAICHGLLPQCRKTRECDGSCLEGFKYVQCSIRRMAERFDALGVRRGEVEVKVFGGADMLKAGVSAAAAATVGKQNVSMASTILAQEGFRIAAEDTGGSRGRKIIFRSSTGEVLLKRLQTAEMREE